MNSHQNESQVKNINKHLKKSNTNSDKRNNHIKKKNTIKLKKSNKLKKSKKSNKVKKSKKSNKVKPKMSDKSEEFKTKDNSHLDTLSSSNLSSLSNSNISSNKNKYSIRILCVNSRGLLNDASTYKNIFEENGFSCDIIVYSKELGKAKPKLYDVNLFLEKIPYNIQKFFPAKINVFMPNQELFLSFDEIKNIDYVICKTIIADKYFTTLKKENKFKYQCIYTKFTTNIPKSIIQSPINKNVNQFVHLAGTSHYKNTSILVYCWISNNGFLDIDSNIELHMTCYYRCFWSLIDNLKKYHDYELKYNQDDKIIKINNLFIYIDTIDENLYTNLLINSNVAICASSQEGYGHYINEARYFKTYIITIDMPPMNELVEDGVNGTLLKKLTKHENINHLKNRLKYKTATKLYFGFPDVDELKEKIIFCIKNKTKLSSFGDNGKKMYQKDTDYFNKTMKDFIETKLIKNL